MQPFVQADEHRLVAVLSINPLLHVMQEARLLGRQVRQLPLQALQTPAIKIVLEAQRVQPVEEHYSQ